MPDMIIARNVLFFVLGCCIFLSLGAFLAKRMTVERLFKYCAFTALAVLIIGVIYIAVLLFINTDPVSAIKDALLIVGVIVAACILLTLGGYTGKKIEVFRVVIGSGIVALVAIIAFLIFLAYLAFFA